MDLQPIIDSLNGSTLALIIGGVLMVVSAFPKLLGKLGETWETWLLKKRRADEIRDDADISDLQRQVNHLGARLDIVLADIDRRDAALHRHAPWDHLAVQTIASLGGTIEPPPPLWPLKTSASEAK